MNKLNNNPKNLLKQKCFQFSIDVIHFAKSLDFNTINQILLKQLIRSATSIGANIVEAFGSGTKRGFFNFFSLRTRDSNQSQV
ncbi:MAG: Uncharacterized protein CEN89_745 [Candidatus Berkelbacteria bacterium Licking1014_7]|uniref:S23 ribosomal protein n=1 Tax=Candidatus Berkelbacteria bacterium Licking1014_7 TaxID=2017147 RepID=A0A554LHL6_9BACT|nr:MAG: Uncharacterized protein CEN89_745 [Candidatus Berkelbacteria bacterium Licking1014_7]